MASRFRPRPDMDPINKCIDAGWRQTNTVPVNDFAIEHGLGASFEQVAINAKRRGYGGNLLRYGFVLDVSEDNNGWRYILPAPLPNGVKAEYVPDHEVFELPIVGDSQL